MLNGRKPRWETSAVDRIDIPSKPILKRRSINSPTASQIALEEKARLEHLPEITIEKIRVNLKEVRSERLQQGKFELESAVKTWKSPLAPIAQLSSDSNCAGKVANSNEMPNSRKLDVQSDKEINSADIVVVEGIPGPIGESCSKQLQEDVLVIPKETMHPSALEADVAKPGETLFRGITSAVASRIEFLSRELEESKLSSSILNDKVTIQGENNGSATNVAAKSQNESNILELQKESDDAKLLLQNHAVSVSLDTLHVIQNPTKHSHSSPEAIPTKSKSLNLLIGRARSYSSTTSLLSSESFEHKAELDDSPPVASEIVAPPEIEPEVTTVKKNIKKKLRANPMSKLTLSNYDLLSSTTGAFRSYGDAYYKFIFEGKSIREGASKLKEQKTLDIEKGKMDKLISDASRAKNGVYHRVVETSREKHKTAICSAIDVKVTKLEELRAYIITAIQKINSSKAYMQELEIQNRILANEHALVVAEYHGELSNTIHADDVCTQQIQFLESTSIAGRMKLMQDYTNFLIQLKEERIFLQNELKAKTQALQDSETDMNDLLNFEQNISSNPDYTKNEVYKALEQKRKHEIELDQRLDDFNDNFHLQKENYNIQVREAVYSIFKGAMKNYDAQLDSISATMFQKNMDLKDEISRHRKSQQSLLQQNAHYVAQKQVLEAELLMEDDPRRQVRHLTEYMNCRPDMEVSI